MTDPTDSPELPVIRKGRKPGSKNKPKPTITVQEIADQAMQAAGISRDQIAAKVTELECRIARLNTVVHEACLLLEQATSLRIGAMDSESRVQDISKQRTQLEQEAHARLRAML